MDFIFKNFFFVSSCLEKKKKSSPLKLTLSLVRGQENISKTFHPKGFSFHPPDFAQQPVLSLNHTLFSFPPLDIVFFRNLGSAGKHQ